MKKIFSFSIIIYLMAFYCFDSQAQDSRVLYFMNNNPHSSYTNPANVYNSKVHVGIPFLSNLNISFYNSAIHYKKLFEKNDTGNTLTVNRFVNSLKSRNSINFALNYEIIGFGFKADNFYISPSYRVRFEEYFTYPDVLFKLPIKGNMEYIDKPAEMKNLRLNATLYHELSVGLQYTVNDNLSLGIRPKLLFGLANINTKKSYFKLTTDPETYEINIQEELKVNTALLFDMNSSDMLNFIPNIFANRGFSMDIGVNYKFNESAGISLSVVDAGFIKWKTNPMNFHSTVADGGKYYKDGGFCFGGFNINGASSDTSSIFSRLGDATEEFIDSLSNYFPLTATSNNYISPTYAKIYLSGYYKIDKNNTLSVMFRGDVVGKSFVPSITLAYSGNFFNMLDVIVTNSIIDKSFFHLGLGLGLRFTGFQMYIATDNIVSNFTPLNASLLNLQMGMFIDVGKTKKERREKFEKENRKEKKNKRSEKNDSNEVEL